MRRNPFILAVLVIANAVVAAAQGDTPAWQVYANPRLGFSLRHPVSMRPFVRDPADFHGEEMGWKLVLDFVSPRRQAATLLRIIVKEPKLPTYPPLDLATLRAACRGYEEFRVGGRVAATCVTCGRASCQWTVHVPGAPELSILSLDRDAATKPGPEDGEFPLKSLINSISFDSETHK